MELITYTEEERKAADDWWNETLCKYAYYQRIRRTGYPMKQYFRRAARQEGHPVMTRRP